MVVGVKPQLHPRKYSLIGVQNVFLIGCGQYLEGIYVVFLVDLFYYMGGVRDIEFGIFIF